MSSMDWLCRFHWLRAAETKAFAAASGASFSKNGTTIFATFWLDKNSQIPSEANSTILSWGWRIVWVMSGSQLHPTEWATVSPIERDIARPGELMFLTHILWGPENLPLQSWACNTLPPLFWTLVFSLGLSGLWSVVSYFTLTFYVSSIEIKIVLESPAFAVKSWLPLKNAPVKVDPDSWTLKTLFVSCSYYAFITEL